MGYQRGSRSHVAVTLRQPVAGEGEKPGQRLTIVLAALVTTAIFGPYTEFAPGVRWEQVVLYGLVVLALPFTWARLRPSRSLSTVLSIWTLIIIISMIGVVAPPLNTTGYPDGRLLAGIDNICLPLSTMMVALIWMAHADRASLLRTVATVTVAAMSVNAVLALISTRLDITWLLQMFWTNERSEHEILLNPSAQVGRLTGIMVMPAEAGALYGIALLASIWLLHSRPGPLIAVASLLTLGGLLTVSKVFILGALPLAVLHLVRTGGGRTKRLIALGIGLVVGAMLVRGGLLTGWRGGQQLQGLAEPTGDLLRFYTAGRLGEESDLGTLASAVISSSPFIGMGAGGLDVAYDGSWGEMIVVAGLVGVALLVGVGLVLVYAWWSQRDQTAESLFSGGLVLLAISASVGLPVFTTASRVSSVLWLLLCLTVLARRCDTDEAEPALGLSAPPLSASRTSLPV